MNSTDMAWIRREIATQLQIILSGSTAATQVNDVVGTESINHSPPGMPTIEGRPLAHPYGMVSRAPAGTVQVVAQQGSHPGNRIVLLHRDKDRPSLNAEGEVMLYDKFGNQVWMQDGKIVVKLDGSMELGEGATKEAARKGDQAVADITTDSTLFAPSGFFTVVATFINALAPGTVVPPTSITSKITQCSSKVKIVD